jgi:hypothetical protein
MTLYVRAFGQLLRFQQYISRENFAGLYQKVRNCATAAAAPSPEILDRICRAVDIACVCYPRLVLCLQRSAATTCLLRVHGVPAQMVMGVQRLPFKAHAWVEVDGRVVNDKSYTPELYAVLDRC